MRPRHKAAEYSYSTETTCDNAGASMRPRHKAAEYRLVPRRRVRRRTRFNEAAA